jgi:nitrite reductase/ring-hydroxylating ferredoxin subunit
MFVYLAYALILGHVLLGVLQYDTSPGLALLLALGMIVIISVHIAAGMREHIYEQEIPAAEANGFVRVCYVHEIPEGRAKVVPLETERVAVFKYGKKLSAVSNVCKHQNGPLGEGKIVDGCITCPWHGYQYLPNNGCSPPPFKEKVATYDVFLINDEVWINPNSYPEGTERPPAIITELGNKPERV